MIKHPPSTISILSFCVLILPALPLIFSLIHHKTKVDQNKGGAISYLNFFKINNQKPPTSSLGWTIGRGGERYLGEMGAGTGLWRGGLKLHLPESRLGGRSWLTVQLLLMLKSTHQKAASLVASIAQPCILSHAQEQLSSRLSSKAMHIVTCSRTTLLSSLQLHAGPATPTNLRASLH